MQNTKKIFKTIAFSLVFVLVIVYAVKHREAYRLYKVITLFDEDVITENFQSMSKIFPHNKVDKGEANYQFKLAEKTNIPASFTYKNESYQIAAYLAETKTTGFLVLKDQKIVKEQYFLGNHIDGLNISWSLNKSFVSALIGIAIDEGFIKSIQDPVDQYVPLLKNSGYQGVSIEAVLQMSSGVIFDEDYADFDSDINKMGRVIALGSSINEFAASLKSGGPADTKHQYVSMDTQVLGMVLKAATLQTPSRYLEEKIWKKLGMRKHADWLIDDYDMELAFGTLNATLRDYARFGLLYQNGGLWQGAQVVPAQWVSDSTTPNKPHLMPGDNSRSNSRFGYGYQWWIPPENANGAFLGRGVYGQYIYVDPKKNVVIVKLSADPNWKASSDEKYKSVRMFQTIANALSVKE